MLAVGAAGAIWHSLDGGESWGMPYSDGDADLFAAAQERTGLIVAGDRGTMQVSVDMGESWRRHTWGEKMIVTEGLLDLDFSRDSSIGLIVGRAGLILKRGAEGEGWKRIVASKP